MSSANRRLIIFLLPILTHGGESRDLNDRVHGISCNLSTMFSQSARHDQFEKNVEEGG